MSERRKGHSRLVVKDGKIVKEGGDMSDEAIEKLAAEFHAVYNEELKRQQLANRHAEDYDSLPEPIKDIDRALAKFVIAKLNAAVALRTREAINGVDACEAHADEFDGPYYINKESAINKLLALLSTSGALGERVKQTRTAWLEQHGVPISREFVHFANAIGDLLALLSTSGTAALACKTDGPMAAHDAERDRPWIGAFGAEDLVPRVTPESLARWVFRDVQQQLDGFDTMVADKVNQAVLAELKWILPSNPESAVLLGRINFYQAIVDAANRAAASQAPSKVNDES